MRRRVSVLSFSLLVWLAAMSAPTWAHHSMAMYDQQKNITITGIVARVELKNPHSLFSITITDKDSKQVEWTLECQPPAMDEEPVFQEQPPFRRNTERRSRPCWKTEPI